MRDLPTEVVDAIQTRVLKARNLVWLETRNRETGVIHTFGWWDDVGTVSMDVVDGYDGTTQNRVFVGNGALLEVGTITLSTDLSVRSTDVSLSPIDETVQSALREYDPRGCNVQILRVYIDPTTDVPVSPATARLVGIVDEAPIVTPAEGDEGSATLRIVSRIRELTRASTSVRSYEDQQRRHSGDEFYKDVGTVGDWTIQWGNSKTTAKATKRGKKFLQSEPVWGVVLA